MQEIIIRKTIKFFGSVSYMAEILKINRSSIYRYLEGKPIPESIASRIVNKTKARVSQLS